MEPMILDTSLATTAIIDNYISFRWTDKYQEAGDFELVVPADLDAMSYLKRGNYFYLDEAQWQLPRNLCLGVIEDIRLKTDEIDGNVMTITGRDLKSFLDRRIIWGQLYTHGNIEAVLANIVNISYTNPTDTNRKLAAFKFISNGDPRVTSVSIDTQYTGDDLYSIFTDIVENTTVGFSVTAVPSNSTWECQLLGGRDMTDSNRSPVPLIFSPDYDNILDTQYAESDAKLKNVAYVGGEGEGSARKYTRVGQVVGLNRREIFVDASDITTKVQGQADLTTAQYTAALGARGTQKLNENRLVTAFDGSVDTNSSGLTYGVDYQLGDIVTIQNEYGITGEAIINEMTISSDREKDVMLPTFSSL